MEIILGKMAGFCYGVNNAVTKAEEYVKNNRNKKIYCLGELVHNGQVVKKLEEAGLIFIDDVSEIIKKEITLKDERQQFEKEATVIIRAHGEPKSTYEFMKNNNIEILDLTCPNVVAIHKLVEDSIEKGFYIFLIGQKSHPEAIGTHGFCKGNCSIIENEEDIDSAFAEISNKGKDKILVVAQTTFSLEKFYKICEDIQNQVNDYNNKVNYEHGKSEITLQIKNTICNATKLRQEETENISKDVNYMIIIGGKNSSNTKKLYNIALKNCKSILIESYQELTNENLAELKTCDKVGITAGTSTPRESIDEVIKYIKGQINCAIEDKKSE